MPDSITVTSSNFTSIVIGTGITETWQAVEGTVELVSDGVPVAGNGNLLRGERGLDITGPRTVNYRLYEGSRAKITRQIWR
jgi:hypothetical protein